MRNAHLMEILHQLCTNSRFYGSVGCNLARGFIKSFLTNQGYQYDLYSTSLPGWSINGLPSIRFTEPEPFEIKGIPAILSHPTPSAGFKGRVSYDGKITMLESYEWDKFAIIDENNKKLGYLIGTSYGSQSQPLPFDSELLPYVIIDSIIVDKLHSWINQNLNIIAVVNNPTIIGNNVDIISVVTKDLSNETHPLICAHYDTVYDNYGAHDNASGVAVALELSRLVKGNLRACRFAFFDGEEVNKAGSLAFVDQLKKSNTINKISYVLEIDAVGIGNEIALLCSKNIFKRLSKLKDNLSSSISSSHKLTLSKQSKIGFSDVWPFMKEDIPVIRMLTRGGVSRNVMHNENDTIDKIQEDTLLSAFNIAKIIFEDLVL